MSEWNINLHVQPSSSYFHIQTQKSIKVKTKKRKQNNFKYILKRLFLTGAFSEKNYEEVTTALFSYLPPWTKVCTNWSNIYPSSVFMANHSGTIHPSFLLREKKGRVTFEWTFTICLIKNDKQDEFFINPTLSRTLNFNIWH